MGGIGNMDKEWQIFVGAGRQIWMMGVGDMAYLLKYEIGTR